MKQIFYICAFLISGMVYSQTCEELIDKGYNCSKFNQGCINTSNLSTEQFKCYQKGIILGVKREIPGGVHNGEEINRYEGSGFGSTRKCSVTEKLQNWNSNGKFECNKK